MIKFNVNFDHFVKVINELPKGISDSVKNSGAAAGATFAKKEMQKNIIANGSIKTGNLLNSLSTRKVKGVHGVYQVYTSNKGPHAHLVEYGTVMRKLKKPGLRTINGRTVMVTNSGSMPAKPFFQPALNNRAGIFYAMRKAAMRALLRDTTKLAGKYKNLRKTFKRKL